MRIHDLLLAWGRGRSIHDPPNDYPSQAPGAHLIAKGDIGMPPLPEEDHERVDATVSAMKVTKPLHHKIIVMAYVDVVRDSVIARRLRMSRSKARETRIAAEHYLEAKLED